MPRLLRRSCGPSKKGARHAVSGAECTSRPRSPPSPQGAAEVGHRELLRGPGGGIREEQDRPDARQSGTPSGGTVT